MPRSAHRPDLTLNAEHRAAEDGTDRLDALARQVETLKAEVPAPARAEAPRTKRKASAQPATPAGAALTRRERKVKDLLLKELAKMNGQQFGSGLTYAEKQHLEKTLNVDYIDKELAKMYKQLGWLPKMLGAAALLFAVLFGFSLWNAATGTDGLQWQDFMLLAPVLSGMFSPFIQIRSIKRRIFIFEALRELSDADEADVTLDRVAREADALIARIVDRELEADLWYPADPTKQRARLN